MQTPGKNKQIHVIDFWGCALRQTKTPNCDVYYSCQNGLTSFYYTSSDTITSHYLREQTIRLVACKMESDEVSIRLNRSFERKNAQQQITLSTNVEWLEILRFPRITEFPELWFSNLTTMMILRNSIV